MPSQLESAVITTGIEMTPVQRPLPPVPWRDPQSVSPAQLAGYIVLLTQACKDRPDSAALRTCLGMAHAMNYDVYSSMDALESAVGLEPESFWPQVKLAELYYRLRALERAERETLRALDLAGNQDEFALAYAQLQTIRQLRRAGTQKPEWVNSLKVPALMLALLFLLVCGRVYWR